MIDPGEDFSAEEKPVLKVDDFKKIYQSLSTSVVDHILKGQELESNTQTQIFTKILGRIAYYITDEP